ncbi:MAG: glutamine--fructose-6-phosphate transaminase (isomerizing) [Magnetococcus sp. WYHC-3]
MCGIIGVIGERNATPVLLEGLRRLEYRGYDSAGIAVNHRGELTLVRAEGKLSRLEERIKSRPVTGMCGVGHTRWATHGAPTEDNAHPHRSARVAVVHNGIIENYQQLRAELMAQDGVVFASETDTEVVPHLVERGLNQGLSPLAAVQAAVARLDGAYALGILVQQDGEHLYAARKGSPLILGLGEGENFIASDATPLAPYTHRLIYLHDQDVAVLSRHEVAIYDAQGQRSQRPVKISQVSADLTDKWPYRHFMQKEIHEQPAAIGETLKTLIHMSTGEVLPGLLGDGVDIGAVTHVQIVACGTSWHAGLVAEYWIESLANLPVSVDIASEYRYRNAPLIPGGLTVAISQSGETADTLAVVRHVRAQGQRVLAVVNVPESSIAREADAVLYTRAGPEIGVASTKAFTTQLTVMACLALALGRARGVIGLPAQESLVAELLEAPRWIERVLELDTAILDIAREVYQSSGFLFLGRGTAFPIALEGALKLKEISYIHAEGYAAGEMKHGPIALIDEHLPVVVVAPEDGLLDKTLSNLEEVAARGGRLIVLSSAPLPQRAGQRFILRMPECPALVAPILYVVPLQLLAYHVAVLKGTDVDQPRNLAKSVTVE